MGTDDRIQGWRARAVLKAALRLVPLALFVAALWALRESLHEYGYLDIKAATAALPPARLAASVGLAALGYLVLGGYDWLAFRFIGRSARLRDIAFASFVGSALGNSVGNVVVAGAAVRSWVYTSIGLEAAEITAIVLFCSLGFWLGFLLLGALVFVIEPIGLPAALHLPARTALPIGLSFLGLLAGYLAVVVMTRRGSFALGRWTVRLPSPALTVGQIAVASADLLLMSSALYVLLPTAPDLSYGRYMAVFLLALVAGTASQVPGGVGVFETIVLLLLSPLMPAPDLVVALLAFRATYFVLPLTLAAALVGTREARRRLPGLTRLAGRHVRRVGAVLPTLLAGATFASGAVLLFSGALPAVADRLVALHRLVALPVIEASHFVASLAGTGLLLLARGIQRRLDAAFSITLVLLAAGSLLSLAKGWDYEEAAVLGVAFAVLLPFRRSFYRKSSLFAEPFNASWAASIAMVLAGSAWLAEFAYKHVEYAAEAWWRFALDAEATRSMRALVGAAVLAVAFSASRLMRPMRPVPALAARADIERARPIIARSNSTHGNLALRGDKSLMFSTRGNALLMYGRMGHSWIAMGDPIGPDQEALELIWRFKDVCDRFDARCVFFEVRPQRLSWYADLGLALTQLGEEARVDLSAFSLEGRRFRNMRQARAKLMREGYRLEILAPEAVPPLLHVLERISDAWLARKTTHEKGFSNASYDPDYMTQFPLAVVRGPDQVVAFANLWLGADRHELSVDLMRHLPDAPNGTMDFLFSNLLLWGRQQGYRWFNFGAAPLSGLDAQSGAPLWRLLGTLAYRHGEHFYNFQGLRQYKEKFGPVWTPLYLASPGGVRLPAVLADVTALIAGGWTGIVSKQGAPTKGPM